MRYAVTVWRGNGSDVCWLIAHENDPKNPTFEIQIGFGSTINLEQCVVIFNRIFRWFCNFTAISIGIFCWFWYFPLNILFYTFLRPLRSTCFELFRQDDADLHVYYIHQTLLQWWIEVSGYFVYVNKSTEFHFVKIQANKIEQCANSKIRFKRPRLSIMAHRHLSIFDLFHSNYGYCNKNTFLNKRTAIELLLVHLI